MLQWIRPASFLLVAVSLVAQQEWTQQSPALRPTPRLGAAMAYSAPLDRIVLFGGQAQPSGWPIQFFADTWTFDGATWSHPLPATSPPARSRHAMVALSSNNVLLFGGVDANGTPLNDVWTWNGSTWTPHPSAGGISPRSGAAMAKFGSGALVFGGYNDFTATYLGDTWVWAGSWAQVATLGAPSPRRDARAVEVGPYSLACVLHGGFDGTERADTWSFGNNGWTQFPQANGPARSAFAMGFDTSSQQVFLAGGRSPNGAMDDLWRFDFTTWRNITPAPRPTPSFDAAATLDTTRHRLVTFGGNTNGVATDQHWHFSSTYPVAHFGVGCASSGPVPTLELGAAVIGGNLVGSINAGITGSVPVALVALGLDNQSWNGVALPLPLGPLGLGCSLLVPPQTLLVFVGGPTINGVGFYFAIPNLPALYGGELFVQGGILDGVGLRAVTDAARCFLF